MNTATEKRVVPRAFDRGLITRDLAQKLTRDEYHELLSRHAKVTVVYPDQKARTLQPAPAPGKRETAPVVKVEPEAPGITPEQFAAAAGWAGKGARLTKEGGAESEPASAKLEDFAAAFKRR